MRAKESVSIVCWVAQPRDDLCRGSVCVTLLYITEESFILCRSLLCLWTQCQTVFKNKDIFFNYYLTHHVWIVSFADSVLKSEIQRAMKPKERGQGQREGNVATRLYHVKVWGKTYYVDKSPKVWVIAGQCSRDSKSSTSRWQMAVLGQKRLWFGRIMVPIRSYYRHCLLIISGKLWRPIRTMLFWLTCPHWLSPLEMSHKLS